ncbi:DUF6297 family protein [Mumia sp.]|uniref:DUF6297 family protein n=1 Tax=Mumia sp. TaxID=1965300 RepID=UPI002638E3DE|nr:DUF6297 family protein [Mumia sp.]MDD9347334.1 DUF6297 family protein [Mumia sp.]
MTTSVAPAQPVPSPRAMRRRLTRVRRAHANRTWLQVAEDAYVAIFSLLMLGVVVGAAIAQVHHELLGCPTAGCGVVREELPVVAAVGTVGVVLRALASIGPVVSDAAFGQWVLATPVARGGLLRRAFAAAVGVAVVTTVALPGLAMTGTTASAATVVTVLVGAAGVGLLATAAATAAQPHPGARRTVAVVGDLLLAVAVVLAAAVALGWSWQVSVERSSASLVAGGLVVLGLVAVVLASTRVSRLTRADVQPGGALVAGLSGAAYGLDPSLVGEVLTARRYRLLGARRSWRGVGRGFGAVVAREAMRLGRSPRRVLALAAAAVVVELGAATGLGSVTTLLAVVVGYAATRWTTASLRIVWRSPGLRRALGIDDMALLVGLAVPGVVVCALWAAGVTALLPDASVVTGIVLTVAIGSGIVRSAASAPPRFDGPLVTSPMGALPPGAVGAVVRGPDATVLAAIAPTLGAPTGWSLALAALVAAWVLWRALAAVGDTRPYSERVLEAAREKRES